MQVKTPAGAWTQRAMDGEPQVASAEVVPSKRDLTSWWKTFKWNNKKEEEKGMFEHLVHATCLKLTYV